MATHSSILVWRIPWTEGAGRLWSIGLQRVWHNWCDLICTYASFWHAVWLGVDWLWNTNPSRGLTCFFSVTVIIGVLIDVHPILRNSSYLWLINNLHNHYMQYMIICNNCVCLKKNRVYLTLQWISILWESLCVWSRDKSQLALATFLKTFD